MLPLARLATGRPRVFPSHPRAEGYYPSNGSEEARVRLVRCLERGEGPALLIGTPGVGKTSLLAVLREQLNERFHVASLTSAQLCTRRALLQSILFSLGQPYRHRDEGDLRIALVDYLTRDPESKNGTVLLVDEAQALPQRLLEELRMLGNLAPEGEASVRLLLAGGPSLEEVFATPENEAFNQRVSTRCYLSPMSHTDTVQYVRAHIAAAGGDAEKLIAGDALDAVYHATDGIARLVNQVCDRALVLAADAGYRTLERAAIETAWADLQQLPTPWNLPPQHPDLGSCDDDDSSNIVEFGPLSEDATPSPAFCVASTNVLDDERNDVVLHDESMIGNDDLELLPIDETPTFTKLPVGVVKLATQVIAKQEVTPSIPRKPVVRRAAVADPFGDSFEEEELVIESFATLEAIVPTTAPRVSNQSDGGVTSQLLADLQLLDSAEASTDDDSASTEQPIDGELGAVQTHATGITKFDDALGQEKPSGHKCKKEKNCVHPCQVDNWDDEEKLLISRQIDREHREGVAADDGLDLLVIDNDDIPLGVANVEKRDYRQLFSSLQRH